MNKNTKRITLGSLAAVAAVAIPIATVASCGLRTIDHEETSHRTMDTWGWSKKITTLKPIKVDRNFSYSINKDTTRKQMDDQTNSNMDDFLKQIFTTEEIKEYGQYNPKSKIQKPTATDGDLLEEETNNFVYSTRITYERFMLPMTKAIKKDSSTFTYTTKAGKKIVSTIDLSDDILKAETNIEKLLQSISSREQEFKSSADDVLLVLDIANYGLKSQEYKLSFLDKFGNTKVMQEMIKETGNTKEQILNKLFDYSTAKRSVTVANVYFQMF